MIDVNDFFDQEIQCIYKGEIYSVRNNGAIMRHARPGKAKRKNDEMWTFGTKGPKGYMVFCTEQVHRIVATAFHGEAPTSQHIIDHKDTNRCNNRPENLHWITKLENILSNPITRRRVILVCGSIEAVLANPSLLGESKVDPNFGWMRTVSPKEAQISKEKLEQWAKEDTVPTGKGEMGEWVFSKGQEENDEQYDEEEPITVQALTPNVIQVNWRTPCLFPLCPATPGDNPLQEYLDKLTEDSVFTKNDYGSSKVIKADWNKEKDSIFVMTYFDSESAVKGYAMAKVTYDKNTGIYYHESRGSYFTDDGAEKYFTIERGYEWTGGDVFDDFC